MHFYQFNFSFPNGKCIPHLPKTTGGGKVFFLQNRRGEVSLGGSERGHRGDEEKTEIQKKANKEFGSEFFLVGTERHGEGGCGNIADGYALTAQPNHRFAAFPSFGIRLSD